MSTLDVFAYDLQGGTLTLAGGCERLMLRSDPCRILYGLVWAMASALSLGTGLLLCVT